MAFSEEQWKEIFSTVQKRVPKVGPCSICGNPNWTLNRDAVVLIVQKELPTIALAGEMIPCIPIFCTNCGNTHLLNMITLGLRHLIEKQDQKQEGETVQKRRGYRHYGILLWIATPLINQCILPADSVSRESVCSLLKRNDAPKPLGFGEAD